jgi:putative ABC transport system ATP-binding protein
VVITHNSAIAGMADRVIHLANGTIGHVEMNAQKLAAEEIRW